MSIQRTSTSFPASTPQWKYDVFLSFRGEDTRRGFTDNLYTALDDEGIITFRDDPELQKGEAIAPALFAAIEESSFSVIVLSKNYASSTWCLDELVYILECMKESGRVVPVFYDVNPSDIRKEKGSFGEAFANHEERFGVGNEKVQRWRSALNDVANLAGWTSKEWYERDLIRAIVEDILKKLQLPTFKYAENLVGMDSRLQPVFSHLDVGVDDVRFIGIWGMGGIGKTTMVRAVYERISREFEFSFLLTNVRETVEKGGLLNLQKQLLSGMMGTEKADKVSDIPQGATAIKRRLGRKKVLLILDDVNHSDQLDYLAGNPGWFGSGSRVLITTRNEHLLIQHEVERRLKVGELNHVDSLQLFSKKAFKKDYPEKDFLGLSESVVSYAKGLPLALEVLGSSLYRRDLSSWNSALSQLGRVSNSAIFDVLQISYNDLDSDGKKIFLDIACFFNGKEKVRVTEVLTCCDVAAHFGIEVLMERSLITLSYGRLWMHDLLQEMGHRIVHLESPNELGRRSRLWLFEDVKHVLTHNTGTEGVEGIFVDSYVSEVVVDATPRSFSMMHKLRYLKTKNVNLPKGLEYLPNSLRILDWTRYPLKSLPADFDPRKLFELTLCHSCIEHVRIGTEPFYKLKTINLSHSLNLVSTPNFKVMPYLEFLYLQGCIRLNELDPGIEVLERLIVLNLEDCQNLVRLPSSVRGLKSLRVLNLSGCSKLKKLPNDMDHLESLEELRVSGSGIRELPSSIGMLDRLHLLKMEGCRDLVSLPISVRGLKSLKVFNISGCSKIDKFPEDLGHMECLIEIDASETSIRELPSSIGMLEGLVSMSLRDCKHLLCLPSSVGGLKSLKDLDLSGCLKLEKLPDELGHVACLEKLDLSGSGMRVVPSCIGLLNNLKELSFAGCKAQSRTSWNMMLNPLQLLRKRSHISVGLSLPCLSGLRSLTKLNLSDCNLSEEAMPSDFGCLVSLTELKLGNNQFVRLPECISQLSRLETLCLNGCRKLRIVPELPYDVWVEASDCMSLDTVGNQIGQSNSVARGSYTNCFKMVENESCESIALRLLARYLQRKPFHSRDYGFVCPGNEIGDWYKHQSVGSTLTLELHPGWLTGKFMEFAACAVFRLIKPLPNWVEWGIKCSFEANGISVGPTMGAIFGREWGQPVGDHMCFFYMNINNKSALRDIYYQHEFSFEPFLLKEEFDEFNVQVKKCGVRVVYEQDVEELRQTYLLKQSNTKREISDAASSSATQGHPKRTKLLLLEGAGQSSSL